MENLAETLRIQREEAQYAQRMQTRTANFAAYQTEKQADVGIAGANALGKMGEAGAGSVNFSGNGDGINMAAMMASMAVGGVVGQNIAGTMNNMMAVNPVTRSGSVPPPIPSVAYHVAINGQAKGPYNIEMMSSMVASELINSNSLVWKSGMPEWKKASDIEELKDLFITIPPIPEIK